MSSLVTVVIPCYNALRWIRETLASVQGQAYGDLEVIVIDDGSTDGGAEIVEREFGFVKLIRTGNQGASRARNLGTSMASGEFIQYLDADDILAEGKIRTQMEALNRAGADVAYGNWQKLVPSGSRFTLGATIARKMTGDPELDLFGSFWCPPAAYLFRRAIVDKVGGWNERLPVIQDARFALDCALLGARFVHCDGIMAFYRVHESGSLSRRSAEAFHRDVYRNAQEVEVWWREHGGLTDARRAALLSCFGYLARATFELDPVTFHAAAGDMERLDSRFTPDGPLHFKIASRLIGYRHAERAAAYYRKAKRSFASSSK